MSNNGRYEYVNGFIFLKDDDRRAHHYNRIREKYGVSPDETWSLDVAIARFMVPRLKAFKKYTCGCPGCLHEQYGDKAFRHWRKILGKMIDAFELICKDGVRTPEESEKINKGLDLFREYFLALWW